MGAGARPVLHEPVGCELHSAAGIARPARKRTEGRAAGSALRQGNVYLYRICVLPATAGGRPWGGAAVCKSDRQSVVQSLVVSRRSLVVGQIGRAHVSTSVT